MLVLVIARVGAAQTTLPESRPDTRPAKNGARLVVLIVVDQLASGVLDSAWPHLGEDGFRRLAREGAWFTRCAYDHSCTETGPGHATLGTGASPRVHGIVGNDWIDAATGEIEGCVDDPKAALIPGGGKGASAHRLLAPTLADAMKAAFGADSKAVSVSIKDRSAILPVGGSADRAVWYDRKAGRFLTSTAFAAGGAPEWLARLEALCPADKFADWTWEKTGPAAAYADLGPDEDSTEHTLDGSRAFPHHVRLAGASSRAWWVEEVCASPCGLELLATASRFLIDDAGLGRREVPDFLAVSFSSNDLVGHLFGPDSHEVRDMTIRVDRVIAVLLAHLDETAGKGRYDVVLSADHGIGPTPERAVRLGIDAGRLNADKIKLAVEAALRDKLGPPPAKEHWVARMLEGDILFNRKAVEKIKMPLREIQDIGASGAAKVAGVGEAIAVHSIFDGTLSGGPIHDAIRRGQMEARSVDVCILPKPHWIFGKNAATHGTPYEYDCRVPLFFFGPGFRHGLKSATPCAPGSAAPTIARVLGIPPPAKADHPVIEEALER